MSYQQHRRLFRFSVVIINVALLLVILFFLSVGRTNAAAGINQQINFQARLLTSSGAVVPDGSYNMRFKIYQDGDGVLGGGDETLKWTEERKQTNRVSTKNGYFSVNLGSVTAISGVDWNQDTLWLSLDVGGTDNTATPTYDGEMTPFKRLAANPYAFNAGQLGGIAASGFVQLSPALQQTGDINVSGTIAGATALQSSAVDTTAAGALAIGNTNASSVSICNSAACDTITLGTNADADAISIGDGLDTVTVTGSSASTIVLNGTTITAAELNLLDGHDVALVDTNDAVATAITGTGTLNAGSITSGFGTIDTGDTVTGTTLNGTTGINTGASAGTQRIDASGNLVNIVDITASGTYNTNTFTSSALTFGAAAGASVQSASAQSLSIDSGTTGALNIGTGANAKAITLGNTTSTTSVKIDSGTGNIDIGTGAQARSTNIATGAAVQTVTVGSTTSTSSVLLQAGTGNLVLQTQGGTLGIGNNAVAQTLTIGNVTGATAVSVSCGTGVCSFGIDDTDHSTLIGSDDGASILALYGGTSGIFIGHTAVARPLRIGTGAAAQDIIIGSTTAGSSLALTSAASALTVGNAGTAFTALKVRACSLDFPSTVNGASANLTCDLAEDGAIIGTDFPSNFPGTTCGLCYYQQESIVQTVGVNRITLSFNNASGATQNPTAATFNVWYIKP